MKRAARFSGISLLAMFLWGGIVYLSSGSIPDAAAGIGIFVVLFTLGGLIASLILFSLKRRESARAMLLSMLVVLIVGFSVCLGGLSL
ncbi:hypothetical protein SAMN05421823_104128 [Catalinimonas alkaloidigena]|uniref:Uncharacterized protein n=1 Tax=Catalinimonas alkaloidigena TaxID=1075417 RepID=A0A1G9GJ68_9BACT|nr:hypothetical protein [Catalinimonas alkaloidigena]SDL00721.1 hypothetical protein SAMN05421823_104128 [Catalinimonas alkaloidigena]